MTRHGVRAKPLDKMLLDFGTTSYVTSRPDRVLFQEKFRTPISFSDDSKVQSMSKGTCIVRWSNETGSVKVSWSGILFASKLSISLLSIAALAKKNIAALCLVGRAIILTWTTNTKFSVRQHNIRMVAIISMIKHHQPEPF